MLVIINGSSATGKTQLTKSLVKITKIPYLSMDEIKETLLNNVNNCTIEIASKSGFEAMYLVAEKILQNDQSIIIEANFHNNEDNISRISKLQKLYKIKVKQIYLYADKHTLWKRIQARKENRHKDHLDINMTKKEFYTKVQSSKYSPLNIDCELLKINTSDFESIDYESIYDFIDMS